MAEEDPERVDVHQLMVLFHAERWRMMRVIIVLGFISGWQTVNWLGSLWTWLWEVWRG